MKHNLSRPLVLRNEGAKHPFRLSLSLDALALTEPKVVAEEIEAPPKKWFNEDASLFVLSFSAFFTAFYLFIV